MKNIFLKAICSAAALAAADALAVPQVKDGVKMEQSGGLVTITYELVGGPAIVTLDIQTNGVSIGGENLRCFSPDSAVWKKVSGDDVHRIVWRPDRSWAGNAAADAKAVVTAWAPGDAPDYMVVDISVGAKPDTARYYPTEAHLPGGLLENPDYRTTSLVLRRMHAKGRRVTSGTVVELGRDAYYNGTDWNYDRENTRTAVFPDDYYIGVFEVTQAQWLLLGGRNTLHFTADGVGAMRPAEGMRPCEVRWNKSDTYYYSTLWPEDPYATSWIGKLNDRTGLDFDLPSEAQWEFAARAGHPEGELGDGTLVTNVSTIADFPGCYSGNAENASAVCGSYAPNDFGLYDTVGNVWEMCLDWWEQNPKDCTSWINNSYDNPLCTVDGTAVGAGSSGSYTGKTVIKGGAWNKDARYCRPSCRTTAAQNGGGSDCGFRLVCRAGLE